MAKLVSKQVIINNSKSNFDYYRRRLFLSKITSQVCLPSGAPSAPFRPILLFVLVIWFVSIFVKFCTDLRRPCRKLRTFTHTVRASVLLQPIIGFWCSVWCWKLPHAVVRRTLSRGKCREICGHSCADWQSRRLWGTRCYPFSASRWDLRLSCRRGKPSSGIVLLHDIYTSAYCPADTSLAAWANPLVHLRASFIQSGPGTVGLFPVSKNEGAPCWQTLRKWWRPEGWWF